MRWHRDLFSTECSHRSAGDSTCQLACQGSSTLQCIGLMNPLMSTVLGQTTGLTATERKACWGKKSNMTFIPLHLYHIQIKAVKEIEANGKETRAQRR